MGQQCLFVVTNVAAQRRLILLNEFTEAKLSIQSCVNVLHNLCISSRMSRLLNIGTLRVEVGHGKFAELLYEMYEKLFTKTSSEQRIFETTSDWHTFPPLSFLSAKLSLDRDFWRSARAGKCHVRAKWRELGNDLLVSPAPHPERSSRKWRSIE